MLSAEDDSMSVVSNIDSADSNYSFGVAEPQLMSMGIYKVNLGTRFGQRMHSLHMLILPLIPIFILLVQNGIKYGTYVLEADEILSVQRQARTQTPMQGSGPKSEIHCVKLASKRWSYGHYLTIGWWRRRRKTTIELQLASPQVKI